MPSTPKKADVNTALPGLEKMDLAEVKYKPPEDEQEKALRLHKERLKFYIKEIVTPGFAGLLVIVALGCCLWLFFNPQSSASEKEWARTLFMSIMTGAIGFAFGTTTK